MCDTLPPTEDPPENYHVDSHGRAVGQIVHVMCKNKTVAVVKCMPDLKWNATVPSCSYEDSPDNLSKALIIVWVVGGILLITLITLIVIIINARSKTGCNSRSSNSQGTSVFHISGNRREGGDNPAFTRADERCGEWSFHRPGSDAESARLPSYQEAILNNYITPPATTETSSNRERPVFIRANAPPSYRTSQSQNLRQNLDLDNGNTPSHPQATGPADSQDSVTADQGSNTGENTLQSVSVTNVEEQSGNAHIAVNQPSASQTDVPSSNQQLESRESRSLTQNEIVSTQSRETNQQGRDSEFGHVASRYAENYPPCFFEEEPPPPYSPGPANYNMYRSPARQSHPQRGANARRGMQTTLAPPSHQRHHSDGFRLAHATRRSLNDRRHRSGTNVGLDPSHRPITSTSESSQSNSRLTNTRAISSSSHHDSGYQSPSAVTTPSTRANSSSNPNRCISVLNPPSSHASASLCESSNRLTSSCDVSRSNALIPSAVPTSASLSTYPSHVSTNQIDDTRQNVVPASTRNNRVSENNQPLYVIRSTHATPSAPPFHRDDPSVISAPSLYRLEAPPLGTSTPIQSPAQVRRFVPLNHPSPLPITRHQSHYGSNPQHVPLRSDGADTEMVSGAHAHFVSQAPSTVQQGVTKMCRPRPFHFVHARQGSAAPIARFDEGIYF